MKGEFGAGMTFERQLEITDFIKVKCIINVYAKMLAPSIRQDNPFPIVSERR